MKIGVDYYPEHWDEERWSEDAKLMREANISVIRLAEFAWSKLEPEEERYQFEWLDKALDTLHAEGIHAILGTPTAAPPAWLHERYPDILPADTHKYRLGFGTRLQRCLGNPIMRRYSRRITEAMARHFASHPAVIGWQTDNEFEANLCYCDSCAERFREWLKAKYGTLEELNRAWGTIFWSQEYSGWSQIPLPWHVRCGESHNPSLKLEYRRFASETTVDFQHEQVEIIRKICPHHFITHNFMGLHDSMDYYELGRDLDFISWDNYPGGSWMQADNSVDMTHAVMRGIKQSNFWVMEEQTHIIGWEKISRRPADGQSRMWAWQAVAHGADTVLFFRWRSCLYGTEQYWHGVLNHDGIPRRRYKEIQKFGEEMEKLSAILDGSTVRNEVAILNSYEQNWAFQLQPQTDGLDWWSQTRCYYNALKSLGIACDITPLTADITSYKLLILPAWYLLTREDAERIDAFATNGGVVVISPRTGVKNHVNVCHERPLPGYLGEIAGVEVDDYDPLGKAKYTVIADGKELSAFTWADALTPKGAETIAFWKHSQFEGEPAVTRNRRGNGLAWYFGTFGDDAFYDALLPKVLADAGISHGTPFPSGVDFSWRVKDDVRYLFLMNLNAEEVTISLPMPMTPALGPYPVDDRVTLKGYDVGVYRG